MLSCSVIRIYCVYMCIINIYIYYQNYIYINSKKVEDLPQKAMWKWQAMKWLAVRWIHKTQIIFVGSMDGWWPATVTTTRNVEVTTQKPSHRLKNKKHDTDIHRNTTYIYTLKTALEQAESVNLVSSFCDRTIYYSQSNCIYYHMLKTHTFLSPFSLCTGLPKKLAA